MATWRLARSLTTLRNEVKQVWPKRDTSSDGTIGDADHSARTSKHNPGPDGIVEAADIDEDIDGINDEVGREMWPFVQHLLRLARAGHPALGAGAHIIYEGRIWSHARGWVERPYTGANAHKRHVHVAVSDGSGKDSTRSWGLVQAFAVARPRTPAPDRWLGLTNPPMVGQDVVNVRHALRVAGNRNLAATGAYNMAVAELVAKFQKNRGITERGVGPKTWAALRAVVHQ